MMTCNHVNKIGDNYGMSCSDCGKQLAGHGYGGFFGSNLTGKEPCIHVWSKISETESICTYCELQTTNDEIELNRHNFRFDRPHVYTCSCGFVAYLHPDGSQTIGEKPEGRVKLLSCGHAVCAKTEQFDCIICMMSGAN